MLHFRLRAKRAFEHQGKKYSQGDTLEVPEHEAGNLIQAGHAEHADPTAAGAASSQGQSASGGPATPGGFQPKKIHHKMYGSKTATTEAEYEAAKDEGWEDDDDSAGGQKPTKK